MGELCPSSSSNSIFEESSLSSPMLRNRSTGNLGQALIAIITRHHKKRTATFRPYLISVAFGRGLMSKHLVSHAQMCMGNDRHPDDLY